MVSFATTDTRGATLVAGALAVVGFTDNDSGVGGTDDIAFLATQDIEAGEVIYFTNNGWSSNGLSSQFNGVGGGFGYEAGFQQMMKLTVTNTIARGTVISTAITGSLDYAWTHSGEINGSGSAHYSKLDLVHTDGIFGLGDQIYIFQSTSSASPMNVAPSELSFIYLLDNGEPLTPGFEEPYDPFGGAEIPTSNEAGQGLSEFDWTAVELKDEFFFHNGSYSLNMFSQPIIDLQTNGGTAAQWLEAIADSTNWDATGLVTGPLNVLGVPEPSRGTLLALALGAAVLRRRRK